MSIEKGDTVICKTKNKTKQNKKFIWMNLEDSKHNEISQTKKKKNPQQLRDRTYFWNLKHSNT